MSEALQLLRDDYSSRTGELKRASVKLKTGKALEFHYYDFRTVAQEVEIEKSLKEHGESQTEALLTAFMVCALDDEGRRLFKPVERVELRKVLAQDVLIDAVLQMGGVREPVDPKD